MSIIIPAYNAERYIEAALTRIIRLGDDPGLADVA